MPVVITSRPSCRGYFVAGKSIQRHFAFHTDEPAIQARIHGVKEKQREREEPEESQAARCGGAPRSITGVVGASDLSICLREKLLS